MTRGAISCHGVLLEIDDIGTLLRGPPGCGKSELALELLRRGHRLIADDHVLLERQGESLVGSAPEQSRTFLAVRGLGILDVPLLFGRGSIRESTAVAVIVELRPLSTILADDDLLGHEPTWTTIASIKIPTLIVTGDAGSNALPTRTECLLRQFSSSIRNMPSDEDPRT